MTKLQVYFGLMLLATCSLTSALGDDKKEEAFQKSLHGMWGVVESEADGKAIELPWTWTFKPDSKVLLIDRKAGKQSLYKYTVDESKQPHRIKIEYLGPERELRGQVQYGVVKLEKERLVVCLNIPGVEDYPTVFKTKAGQGFLMKMESMPTE